MPKRVGRTVRGAGLEELVERATSHIVEHEDREAFQIWLAEEGPRYLDALGLADVPRQIARRVVGLVGRSIWSATPLPSRGFSPEPLPAPAPAGPCPCGSQAPFESCCGLLPEVPPLPTELVWRALARRGPLSKVVPAARAGALPAELRHEVAERLRSAGREDEARGLVGKAQEERADLVDALEGVLARPLVAVQVEHGEGGGRLVASEAVRRLEASWHALWGRRGPDGRSAVTEEEVVNLLGATPEIGESLDTIQALAEMAEELERQGHAAGARRLSDRLFERGEEALRRGLALAPQGLTLPWSRPENRVALELLRDGALRHEREGRVAAARACAQTLLLLDTRDPLGARAMLDRIPAPTASSERRRPSRAGRRRR